VSADTLTSLLRLMDSPDGSRVEYVVGGKNLLGKKRELAHRAATFVHRAVPRVMRPTKCEWGDREPVTAPTAASGPRSSQAHGEGAVNVVNDVSGVLVGSYRRSSVAFMT
jgi:hypothetical protein